MTDETSVGNPPSEAWIDRVRDGLRKPEGGTPRYEILEKLGEGGMGVVYLARDLKLNRSVALKILQSSNPDDAKRFVREGQIAARLSHPNIVTIHEVGELDGRPFIAMEFLPGRPLSELRIEPRRAAGILRDVAQAVEFAHGQGVIHRDLKPANLLLSKDGHVWVLDFGLARPIEPGATITMSAFIVGTPAFMSPEQAQGKRCDVRSDVYSLGATLYQLLTGRPPFDEESPLAVLTALQSSDPLLPRRLNPRVPRDLETITLKALEKDPSRRYGSAKELAEDLGRFLEGLAPLAKPVGIPSRAFRFARRHKAVSAAIGVALAFGVAFAIAAAVRSGQRDRIAQEARGAWDREDWSSAAELYGRLGLPAQRRAAEEMGRAVRALAARDAAERRARDSVPPSFAPHEPASQKEALWEAEAAIESARQQVRAQDQEAEQAALSALALDPTIPGARILLAGIYVRRYEAALPTRDTSAIEWWAQRSIEFGGLGILERFRRPAMLSLRTHPDDVQAFLFRYEERKLRLVPFPCNARGEIRQSPLPSVDALPQDATEEEKSRAREESAYSLPVHSFNEVAFPLTLAPGSYLVLFTKEGWGATRYPVSLGPGECLDAEVRLARPSSVPEGFVYVPEGRFVFGGDPLAEETAPDRPTTPIGGYLLARFSVTAGQYLDFLKDRTFQTRDEAWKRQPRIVEGNKIRYFWNTLGEDWSLEKWSHDEPILGVSAEDALAFAHWYTRQKGRATWRFRLPTEEEWEKAARGADGRYFPWGNRFDHAFAAVRRSRPGISAEVFSPGERVGLFPADESPFGVRDMAGVIGNWTSTVFGDVVYATRGGGWINEPLWSRSASRGCFPSQSVSLHLGIRLAADLPREDE